MVVERFLGAGWASVHGPTEPAGFVVWALDQGFRGLVPGSSPRPIDWPAVVAAMRDFPASIPALRIGSVLAPDDRPDADLASTHAGQREAALATLEQAVRVAQGLGTPRILLEPGRARVPGEDGPVDLGDPGVAWTEDRARAQLARRNACLERALDATCRSLHRLCRTFPEVEFSLTGSRHVFGLGEPAALAAIFEDLSGCRLTYWHDVAVEARRAELLGVAPGLALEEFGKVMVGMTLGDSANGLLYLPPGAGGVDYHLVSAYRTRHAGRFPVVVELDPAVETGEIPGVHAFLNKFGL